MVMYLRVVQIAKVIMAIILINDQDYLDYDITDYIIHRFPPESDPDGKGDKCKTKRDEKYCQQKRQTAWPVHHNL